MTVYISPHASVSEESAGTVIAPIVASPNNIVLIGPSVGGEIRAETIILEEVKKGSGSLGPAAVNIPYVAVLNEVSPKSAAVISVIAVRKPYTGLGGEGETGAKTYTVETDYKVKEGENGNTTIENVKGKAIPIPEAVTKEEEVGGEKIYRHQLELEVEYQWVPANYFFPQEYSNIQQIAQVYGPPLDPATKTKIYSPLTFAANLALLNGAGSVIIQPIFKATEAEKVVTRTQPTAKEATEAGAWINAYNQVALYVEDIDLIVPVSGQAPVSGLVEEGTDAFQQEVYFQLANLLTTLAAEEAASPICIIGDDSSYSAKLGTKAKLYETIAKLRNVHGGKFSEQFVYIDGSVYEFELSNPLSRRNTINVGGQYMAAAFAGAITSRPVSQAMTRKSVVGFAGIPGEGNAKKRLENAAAGFCVMETVKGNIRCRQGITIDQTSVARQEISVVRAKFNLITSIKETLENNIIGQIIADANSPYIVRSAIAGVLSELQSAKDIVSYSEINCEIASLNPTKIKATFQYRPAFTVNIVEVGFEINTATGVVNTLNVETL